MRRTSGRECETESCDRSPTHYVEYPTSRGFFTGCICVACLHAIEAGMDANAADRQCIEIECIEPEKKAKLEGSR